MPRRDRPAKYSCHCGKRFRNWLAYQWHKTDAHPLFRDKQ